MPAVAEIIFHGVRGSAPASGAPYATYGGDTPCIEVAAGSDRIFIDAGSGLKNVSPDSVTEDIDLILSHYHFDHLIGLPFFDLAWRLKGRLRIWAPAFDERPPRSILETFYSHPFCPVGLGDLRVRTEVRSYRPGDSWAISGGVDVATILNDHPGGSAAVRIRTKDGDMVYASDAETADGAAAARLSAFAAGANLFIMDAMNDDATAGHRRGWGHSSWREAIAVGEGAGAQSIALFHHDPRAADEALFAVDAQARQANSRAFLAMQGMRTPLHSGAAAAPAEIRGGETTPWRCNR